MYQLEEVPLYVNTTKLTIVPVTLDPITDKSFNEPVQVLRVKKQNSFWQKWCASSILNMPTSASIVKLMLHKKHKWNDWLFSVSEAVAKANAICLSLAETAAKANGIDFYQYLVTLMTELPNLLIHQQPEILDATFKFLWDVEKIHLPTLYQKLQVQKEELEKISIQPGKKGI